MRKSRLFPAVLLVCLSLASCAPVIVGRTPQPAAPEEWEFSLNLGYPLLNPYENDPLNGPTQTPTAQPVNLFLSRGVAGNTEVNGTLSLSLAPSLRLGGKTLLISGMIPVAIDYGVFIPDIGFDAGLLFSYPQPGVELYGALRGFMNNVVYLSDFSVAGALTIGADIPAGSGNFFIELTAHTTMFEGAEYYNAPLPPIGFSIVPALGYRF
ncbi:MAG: hypothetical protein M3511_11920 [Deinococcota bacterium]|nr:hypothetical protein [Deinococcota bacterium]